MNGTPIPDTYGPISLDTSLNDTIGQENDVEDTDEVRDPVIVEHENENKVEDEKDPLMMEIGTHNQNAEKNPPEDEEKKEEKEYDIEELKTLLTKNNIKFHHMLGIEKLAELCSQNNLL